MPIEKAPREHKTHNDSWVSVCPCVSASLTLFLSDCCLKELLNCENCGYLVVKLLGMAHPDTSIHLNHVSFLRRAFLIFFFQG